MVKRYVFSVFSNPFVTPAENAYNLPDIMVYASSLKEAISVWRDKFNVKERGPRTLIEQTITISTNAIKNKVPYCINQIQEGYIVKAKVVTEDREKTCQKYVNLYVKIQVLVPHNPFIDIIN